MFHRLFYVVIPAHPQVYTTNFYFSTRNFNSALSLVPAELVFHGIICSEVLPLSQNVTCVYIVCIWLPSFWASQCETGQRKYEEVTLRQELWFCYVPFLVEFSSGNPTPRISSEVVTLGFVWWNWSKSKSKLLHHLGLVFWQLRIQDNRKFSLGTQPYIRSSWSDVLLFPGPALLWIPMKHLHLTCPQSLFQFLSASSIVV